MSLPARRWRYCKFCNPALLVSFFFNISRSYLTHMRGNTAHFWTGLIKRPASKFLHWDLPDVRFDFVWASTKKVKNKNKVKNKKISIFFFYFIFIFLFWNRFAPFPTQPINTLYFHLVTITEARFAVRRTFALISSLHLSSLLILLSLSRS